MSIAIRTDRFRLIPTGILENPNDFNGIYLSPIIVADEYPLHGHDFHEIELVLDGGGYQWINNVKVPITRGSLYSLSPADIHRLEATRPIYLISIRFIPNMLGDGILQECHDAYATILSPEDMQLYSSLLIGLAQEQEDNLPFDKQKTMALASLLQVYLLRRGKKYPSVGGNSFLPEALSFIREHSSDPNFRLEDVAGACSLSPSYFSALFRKTIGCGFSKYLTNYRLLRACAMLNEKEHTVSEIAYEVGFSSLSHFFRTFQAHFQCTPKQYRQRLEEKVPAKPAAESEKAPAGVPLQFYRCGQDCC